MNCNIILIGMPGSGKSTLGQKLAQDLSYHFVDTDEVIMETFQDSLMHLIAKHGTSGFIQLEGSVISSLHTTNSVISTGGSAVYNANAMEYLKSIGFVIYLYHDVSELKGRVGNMTLRGVVCQRPCMTVEDLFVERSPLYAQYADVVLDLTGKNVQECSEILFAIVRDYTDTASIA